jgi:type 1 glutamine amidotransferase
MRRALIVQGGWEGHEPRQVSDILANSLRENEFRVEIADTLDAFRDLKKLQKLDLIIPQWTMGQIAGEQLKPMQTAVAGGVGIAGLHGGMGDAFRQATSYQFMVGGQFVAHPGGGNTTYEVCIVDQKHPISRGMKSFFVTSEQYYMHVDPGNHVLAVTCFGDVVMPVAWTRTWGKGRVFYSSLGHSAAVTSQPEVLDLMTRGMLWAARAPLPARRRKPG